MVGNSESVKCGRTGSSRMNQAYQDKLQIRGSAIPAEGTAPVGIQSSRQQQAGDITPPNGPVAPDPAGACPRGGQAAEHNLSASQAARGNPAVEAIPTRPEPVPEESWKRLRALVVCPKRQGEALTVLQALWGHVGTARPRSLLILTGHPGLGHRKVVVSGPFQEQGDDRASGMALARQCLHQGGFEAARPGNVPSMWREGPTDAGVPQGTWGPYAHLPGVHEAAWLAEHGGPRDMAWGLIGASEAGALARALAGSLTPETLVLGVLESGAWRECTSVHGGVSEESRNWAEALVGAVTAPSTASDFPADLIANTLLHLARGLHWEGRLWSARPEGGAASPTPQPAVEQQAVAFFDPPVGSLLTPSERGLVLRLARRAVESAVRTGRLPEVNPAELPLALLATRACFVTLTREGQLRGCIGHLKARMPLYQAVLENARAAALEDYRFEPVRPSELEDLRIEVSVLTPPRPLAYKTPEELLQGLRPGVDGVILEIGSFTATFLPQVWEKLPGREQFLDQLCIKAGARPADWRRLFPAVSTYQVEAFAEDDNLSPGPAR